MGGASSNCSTNESHHAHDTVISHRSHHSYGGESAPPTGSEIAALTDRPFAPSVATSDDLTARTSNDKVVLPGGARYEGSMLGNDEGEDNQAAVAWSGPCKHGQGTLVTTDGMRYVGQFQFDQKSGYGTYSYPSGSTYSGQWADDLQNGHGTENWADGSAFEGQFKGGEKQGWGRFMWGNGCLYEGEFERNDMHGEGSYAWSDGRMYSGQWGRNFMGPAGTMQWPDGRVYEGDFLEGKKHGEGTHWWPDGRSYRGQWREGKQHGQGLARTSKGIDCKGIWDDGKFVRWLEPSPANAGSVLVDPDDASPPDINERTLSVSQAFRNNREVNAAPPAPPKPLMVAPEPPMEPPRRRP